MSVLKNLHHQFPSIPPYEIEILCAHALGVTREYIIAHPEVQIGRLDIWKLKRLLKKRMSGIPIAYLTEHKEFFGLDFIVNKHVLVPRPDTEILVTTALEHVHTRLLDTILLIDVGTGSGCIPISIMKTVKHENSKAYAIDISRKALRIAKKNAKSHNVDISFLHGNLLEPLATHSSFLIPHSSLIITANLPYLTQKQFQNEPSIHHEPHHALVAENNGLALYEELLKQLTIFYSLFPIPYSLFIEIDPSQTQQITKLIKQYVPQSNITIHKDLTGHDRVVKVNFKRSI